MKKIILILMPVRYDLGKIISSNYMPRELWVESLANLKEFLKILKIPDIKLNQIATFQKDGEPYYLENSIKDTLCTILESLDNELFKGFKNSDFTSIVLNLKIKLFLCKIYYFRNI